MKVIVVGNGFIASHLHYEIIKERLTTDSQTTVKFLDKHKPDVVINCIGHCGYKNIDDCETNQTKTVAANITIPAVLGSECYNKGIHFIHLSSGCIFNGQSPNMVNIGGYGLLDLGWNEKDIPNPVSFYSRTKLACELALSGFNNTAILRLRMPISWKNEPRNLLSKLVSYKEVVEIPNSITFLNDLSRSIDFLIGKKMTGTYNITSPMPILHSEILKEYQKHYPNHNYKSITPHELDRKVIAPRSNCILDSSKIQNEGFEFQDQKEALTEYVSKFVSNSRK